MYRDRDDRIGITYDRIEGWGGEGEAQRRFSPARAIASRACPGSRMLSRDSPDRELESALIIPPSLSSPALPSSPPARPADREIFLERRSGWDEKLERRTAGYGI
jgi:hypothetical protein